ncbi:MAG: DUF1749 domain-containing protein [Candidatus Marsarchaeota archaeon]|jgi:alpha-beta hydrolase superfamily lysophospholipase|nr:DUF1749 domain-containing protein [Candidatus Marsarchaeota archaeon]
MFAKRLSIEKFSATDGTLLYGLLALPRKGRPKAAVLHVHGFTGSFYGSTAVEELSAAMTKRGIVFFSIQTRGSYSIEEFTKRRGAKETDYIAGGALEKFEDCVYDIEGAVRFLKGKGMKKIILEGHSTGCQKIVYYSAMRMDRAVKALILLTPVDDTNFDRANFGKRYNAIIRLARSTARRGRYALMPLGKDPYTVVGAARLLSTADPKNREAKTLNYLRPRMDYIEKIRVPILAVFGTDDRYMNVAGIEPSYAIAKLRKSCSKPVDSLIIKGEGHGFAGKRKFLARKAAEWASKHA